MTQRDSTKLVPISAEVEASLRDEIRQLAQDGDRSFSAEVRRALRWYAIESNRKPSIRLKVKS